MMNGGAQVELGGDALLEEAQALNFFQATMAMQTPRCKAAVAIKNCGRSLADVGAKFRNKGGLEVAAYDLEEASVYLVEAATALKNHKEGGPAAASTCESLAGIISRAGKGEPSLSSVGNPCGCALIEAFCSPRAL